MQNYLTSQTSKELPLEVLIGLGKHFEDQYRLICEFELTSSVLKIRCSTLENKNRYLFSLEIRN